MKVEMEVDFARRFALKANGIEFAVSRFLRPITVIQNLMSYSAILCPSGHDSPGRFDYSNGLKIRFIREP
jgi:hypothetical protein